MRFGRFFSLLVSVLLLTGGAVPALAQGGPQDPAPHDVVPVAGPSGEPKKMDVAAEIFGHVSDSHEWHITQGFIIPLPVIAYSATTGLSVFSASKFGELHPAQKDGNDIEMSESYNGYHLEKGIKEKLVADDGSKVYDFSITKNVLCMFLSVILLLTLVLGVSRKYNRNGAMKAPSGFQNALEPCITFIRDEVAKPNLGHKYMRYMPMLLTMFFFIWMNNLLGLLPFGFNFTGNIAVTVCLALISFIVLLVNANKHFWGHLLNPPGVPLGIKFLLVPIEIISLFIKPVALTIRLFANMLAGHIVILCVVMLIFIFAGMSHTAGWVFSPVSMVFTIFMFFLELLVAAIQAFIFTNLTAVFIGQAIEDGHHEKQENGMDHAVHEEIIM